MKKLLQFIKYNNFFTLILMCVIVGSGVTLAATPAVQDSLISSHDTVRSVDNSYIIGVNLSNYNFSLKVTNVTEDATNYYVDYSYSTIALQDYVWQNVTLKKTLTVDKKSLNGKDLGLFVSDQLGQIIDSQLAYLTDAQKIEIAKGKTTKVVSTQYSGLIGSVLGSKDKVFEGYQPVIPEVNADTTHSTSTLADVSTEGRSQSIPQSQQSKQQVADEIKNTVNDILKNPLPTDSTPTATTTPVTPVTPDVSTSAPVTPTTPDVATSTPVVDQQPATTTSPVVDIPPPVATTTPDVTPPAPTPTPDTTTSSTTAPADQTPITP